MATTPKYTQRLGIEAQAPQCALIAQSGPNYAGSSILEEKSQYQVEQKIKSKMNGILCRCGAPNRQGNKSD